MISSARSSLRLFTGSETGNQESETSGRFWTIRQAFEQKKRPEMLRSESATATIKKWEKAIWYWEQVTDNPPLIHITEELLTDFPERLLEPDRKLGVTTNTTANQKLMYVRGIMKSCDKYLPRIPRSVPLPSQPATRHRRIVPVDLLDAMYRGCHAAKNDPSRLKGMCKAIPSPALMRAVLAFYLLAPCRRTEGFKMERTAYRRQVEFPDFPEHPGFEVEAESPFGWLVFHTPKTARKKKGLPLVLPVHPTLALHLDCLDKLAPNRKRLLPLGNNPTTWQHSFNRIQKAAGIVKPYTWQDLRKTGNRLFRKAGGREVAKFMLGQQPRGVNAQFYDDLTEDAVEALSRVQLPECFQNL